MKVIVFGASGMIGQGVLRECLLDAEVESVLVVGRRPCGVSHDKLSEIVHADFSDWSAIESRFAGCDACLFCLGVSSAGMSEPEYRRLTYDLTLTAARALLKHSPNLVFEYISGKSTDSSERGASMWARVKGQTENALLALPFRAAYMLRPGYIQPLHGARSSTRWTRVAYALAAPLYPLWKTLWPKSVTTTEDLARVMLEVAKRGARQKVLEASDIVELSAGLRQSPA